MKIKNTIFQTAVIFMLALSIPALLALDSMESKRYSELNNKVYSLEKRQRTLIESNKRIVNDIGLLSSSARIEKIALEELAMHKAASNEIVRIDIEDKK